jgi:hypothetical protein
MQASRCVQEGNKKIALLGRFTYRETCSRIAPNAGYIIAKKAEWVYCLLAFTSPCHPAHNPITTTPASCAIPHGEPAFYAFFLHFPPIGFDGVLSELFQFAGLIYGRDSYTWFIYVVKYGINPTFNMGLRFIYVGSYLLLCEDNKQQKDL